VVSGSLSPPSSALLFVHSEGHEDTSLGQRRMCGQARNTTPLHARRQLLSLCAAGVRRMERNLLTASRPESQAPTRTTR
jgi:hypothetical protein